jgi:hypothetical protein
MAHIIKFRRDSATRWRQANPVLGEGEPGYERDTGKFKIGNGNAAWTDLPYIGVKYDPTDPGEPTDEQLYEHIHSDLPHPVYDDGPSLVLIYENAKV